MAKERLPIIHMKSAILNLSNGKCFYCEIIFSHKFPSTVDHIIPLDAGGKNDLSNLIAACGKCNSRKSTKYIGEYFDNKKRLEKATKTYLGLNEFEWQVLKYARKLRRFFYK